ncbi:MAG TPA: response regulator [Candidatus Acidoferrales bacterium]|nr:response regulator [Candidatus Acidoferrales bacterium]
MPKVLIVEDNEPNRQMLARRLERKGFSVVAAPDGAEGYSLARAETPDLILMDISLPGMDGWETIGLLKSESATRDIPVVILTAHALIDDRSKAVAVGCGDYFSKPVDFQRLLDRIGELLTEKKPV